MPRIAIIGAGAAGVAALHALTHRTNSALHIELFDPGLANEATFARGLPYGTDPTGPLLNAPAHVMSICARDERLFARWLGHGDDSRRDSFTYATRSAFGDYLRATLRALIDDWAHGPGVLQLVPAQVENLSRTGDALPDEFGGLRIRFEDSRVLDGRGLPQAIYAVGALAQGGRYYVNALDGIVTALEDVVRSIAMSIHAPAENVIAGER